MKNTNLKVDGFLNLKNLKNVLKRISEAPYHVLCTTTNYTLFSHNVGNRDGIQTKRIANFRKKIQENKYYPILGHIFVNNKGVILEGNHRFDACVAEKKPIIFMVIDNMTINQISDYNTNKVSASWKNVDNFGSALTFKYELASILDDIRTTLVSDFSAKGINENDITPGEMYSILTERSKYFGAGVNAVTLEMWESNEFVDKARTIDFYNTIESYVKMKAMWNFNVHKRFKACKAIMECTFAENKKAINFKLENFIANLNLTTFKFKDSSGVNDFVEEAIRIHNIKLPKHLRAISL